MAKNNSRRLFSAGNFFSTDISEKLLKTKLIWYWAAFILLTFVVLISSAIGSGRTYEAGDIAKKSLIYEGSTFSYTSDVAYDKAVADIESAVNDVYTLDKSQIDTINSQIDSFLDQMTAIKKEPDATSDTVVSIYKGIFGDSDTAAAYESALNTLSLSEITDITSALRSYFVSSYAQGIKEADLEAFLDGLNDWIDAKGYKSDRKEAAKAIVSILDIKANYVLDEKETDAVTAKRVAEIQPVEVTVRSGQKIVDEGTEITAEQLETLQKAGMLSEGKGLGYFLGAFFFTLFLYFLLFLYCKKFFPFYAFDREGILLIGLITVVFLLLCQIIMVTVSSATGTLHSVLGYLLPLSAVALIFTTLTNQRLAFVATTFCGLFMALLVQNQATYLLVAAATALFTVYSVGRIRERYQVVSFGLYLGLVNMLSIFIFGMMGEQSVRTVLIGGGVGLLAGFLSAFIALGSIPLLENSLKLATPMKLMELSSTGHPLIKRLMAEAPGTYYHSILVANLAEAAADAIGADALLVRVASYYHDIGKLERPAYFTENQDQGINPHDKISPALSTLIIVSHVKDGIEMAKEYGLPEDVVNIIAEHHGDSVIKYFYHKAKDLDPEAREEDYSYPFSKPQTRESAIVMMADTVQAALQSMGPLSKGEMAARIHSLIQGRLAEGEFEECNLTFKDLHVIQDAFVSVYDGMTHHRVKYPDFKALAKKTGLKVDVPEPHENLKAPLTIEAQGEQEASKEAPANEN